MRLTVYSDYAVRVLIYLSLYPDRLVPVAEISDAYNISRNHLIKVTSRLIMLGLVQSRRGRSGGIRLMQAPADINLGTLIRGTEDEFAPAECFRPDNRCVITPACRMAGVFGEALNAFLTTLDHYTLADIITPVARLENLLHPPANHDSVA